MVRVGRPWVFVKFVPVQPSSAARAFMRATKSEIEPLTYCAITLQASLAEATIAQ